MTEETTQAVVAPETTPIVAPVAPAPQADAPVTPSAETATTPSWVKDLETADPDALRKHPRVAAIVGDLVRKNLTSERQRLADENTRAATRTVEQQLLTLLDENEESVTSRYPAVAAHLKALRQTQGQRASQEAHSEALNRLAASIGKGFQSLPEWPGLTAQDHETLAKSVAGLADDDVLPAYNARALDLIAERRAEKKAQDRMSKELATERDAIRKEESAKLLQRQNAPSTARPSALPTQADINAMSDKEFDTYWNRRFSR